MRKILEWLDERVGLKQMTSAMLDEEIRGGARWAYVLGSAVLFVFLIQALTGIFLTMYYVPSSDHAHVSVAYIQKVLPGGSLVRGLHYYGASAFIILILAHMTQVFLFGAYKKKRELTWLAGGLLLLLALGFGFTGYLLPWDQEAYFGTKVGTSIAGEIPIVGSIQQHIMLGGSEISSLTLSRFFMVHVFILPLGLLLFIGLHLFLFRKAGPAGPYHRRDDARVDRFYPRQLWKDTVIAFLIFVVLVSLARFVPAHLGPQADPTSDYLARPAWYFLPLFQLLKYFPGRLSLIPTVGLPTVIFGLIFALPFIDRSPERHPLRRPVATAVFLVALIGAIGLGVVSRIQDQGNPEFSVKLKEQAVEAEGFLRTNFVPQDNGRSIAVTPSQASNPQTEGSHSLKIFLANCASCHGTDANGGPLGPSLVNIARRRRLSSGDLANWIVGHNRELSPGSMPAFRQLKNQDLVELSDWLLKLDRPVQPALATEKASGSTSQPPKAYADNCAMCHGDNGEGGVGPALSGVTSKPRRQDADLMKILTDSSRQYGLKDPMPASFPALTNDDRQAIVKWLHSSN